jgi:hypothetical protein
MTLMGALPVWALVSCLADVCFAIERLLIKDVYLPHLGYSRDTA